MPRVNLRDSAHEELDFLEELEGWSHDEIFQCCFGII
jgi:hypothetical protein